MNKIRFYLMCIALGILISLGVVYLFLSSPTRSIKITGNAIAYNIEIQIHKTIPIQLDGTYDKSKNTFLGTLNVGGTVFKHTIIANGFQMITYDNTTRTLIGTAYINSDMTEISLEFNREELLILNEGGTSVVSYPANNLTEAVQLNQKLKAR
ncbi:hypothetical protein [Paenibacillus alginolyticus]|uniref:Bacterial Pleckstrin homology domain-containing protein n=1 Tax=Paenibacillus alginolyticus TaxID=59839 RepID=A0ABT4GQA8_9BACL|nr:hypothetical protein [Paenibacillus alginolyticus]MCY9698386.1 hypothetical protein [Paenibacillus alginolyticus]MEC0148915.1 hypothetical protein [Paenibacillus alginolyticus]